MSESAKKLKYSERKTHKIIAQYVFSDVKENFGNNKQFSLHVRIEGNACTMDENIKLYLEQSIGQVDPNSKLSRNIKKKSGESGNKNVVSCHSIRHKSDPKKCEAVWTHK